MESSSFVFGLSDGWMDRMLSSQYNLDAVELWIEKPTWKWKDTEQYWKVMTQARTLQKPVFGTPLLVQVPVLPI
jgi:hypothetical protein